MTIPNQKGGDVRVSVATASGVGAAIGNAEFGSGRRSRTGNRHLERACRQTTEGKAQKGRTSMIIVWLWLLLGATYPSLVSNDAANVLPGGMVEKVRSLPSTPAEPSEELKSERVQAPES
jgi:hypothetical protein